MLQLFDDVAEVKSDYIYHYNEQDINSGIRFHNGYEFFYVYDGAVVLTADGNTYPLSQGEAAVIAPDTVHSYKARGESRSYMCVFSSSYVPEFSRYHRTSTKPISVFRLRHGENTVDNLQNAGNRLALKGMLYYLLSYSIEEKQEENQDQAIGEIAEKVLKYIEQNYSQEITLKDVADSLNYQYNYLSKLINKLFKMSFSKLLNRYRIYTAQQLLRTTDYKITYIASECGYSSLRSFNRNFKRITGFTPTEYNEELNI